MATTQKAAKERERIAALMNRITIDLKRDGETKVSLSEAALDEDTVKKMIESGAYAAGFAGKVTIRKRKGVLTGKLDRD